MQCAVTANGERYDRCLGCGRLWHIDRELGVVVGARPEITADDHST
jgi:hypothetical protein